MSKPVYMAVGSVTRETPYYQNAHGTGIQMLSLNEDTLESTLLASAEGVDNPTFLSVDAATATLYVNSEVFGWVEGTISVYRFNADASSLTYINKQVSQGSITAYNAISANGRFLLAANYAAGRGGPDQSVVALPIREDGGLGPVSGGAVHPGAALHDPERQERSHAHCIVQTVDRTAWLCADLGLDQILIYTLDETGGLTRTGAVNLPEGSGPRHIAQHGKGQLVYVSNELTSTVSALSWDGHTLTLLQTVPSAPPGFDTHGADIHLSPDGRFLYASNRGHDSLAAFRVDPQTGLLTFVGYTPCGGRTPRNFAITPSGRHVLVANQNSDHIAVFACNSETGALSDTGKRIETGTPVCIRLFVL